MQTHEVWEVCFDCGVVFTVPWKHSALHTGIVMSSEPMPPGGWLCNDCDKKHNPED